MGSVYTDHWNEAKEDAPALRLCQFFDADDTVIASPEMFTAKAHWVAGGGTSRSGHYHMGITATRPEAQDSFAAKLESVSGPSSATKTGQEPVQGINLYA